MNTTTAPLAIHWTSTTHFATYEVHSEDVRNGRFPLMCGRWAPDGFDAEVCVGRGMGQTCKRCAKAASK